MPIWLEILVLMLVAYALGLAIGWAVWGRADKPAETRKEEESGA